MSEVATELELALSTGLLIFATGLFAGAALHKLRTFTEFTGFVSGYRLLPGFLVRPASGAVVLGEVAAIAGPLGPIPVLAFLPALLLLMYAAAMGVNLLRGRTDIDCGCGGTPMPISTAAVVRNLALAGAFSWAATRRGDPLALLEQAPALLAAAVVFALCLGVLYAVFNQLEANRANRERLWQRPA